jgi:hypothetical protein
MVGHKNGNRSDYRRAEAEIEIFDSPGFVAYPSGLVVNEAVHLDELII